MWKTLIVASNFEKYWKVPFISLANLKKVIDKSKILTKITSYIGLAEAYLESTRRSTMELFLAKIINGFYPLAISAERSIVDIQLVSKYVSVEGKEITNELCFSCKIWLLSFTWMAHNRYNTSRIKYLH